MELPTALLQSADPQFITAFIGCRCWHWQFETCSTSENTDLRPQVQIFLKLTSIIATANLPLLLSVDLPFSKSDTASLTTIYWETDQLYYKHTCPNWQCRTMSVCVHPWPHFSEQLSCGLWVTRCQKKYLLGFLLQLKAFAHIFAIFGTHCPENRSF